MQAGFSQFRDALERARSDFLSGRDVPAGVREQIATSWRRSSLCGVVPDVSALPYDADIDVEGRLAAAAFPVLNRLADRLEDQRRRCCSPIGKLASSPGGQANRISWR